MEQYMWAIWLAIASITLIIEVSIPSLVSVWFSLSALVVMALSFIPGLPYWGEIILFVILTLLLLVATRPFVLKLRKGKKDFKSNVDSLIGKHFMLIKTVEKYSKGELNIHGVIWDAQSEDGSVIESGKEVVVINVDGNKLIVKEVKEHE